MPQEVAQSNRLALLLKTVCRTSHKKMSLWKNPKCAINAKICTFWTDLAVLTILDASRPILRVFNPTLAENTRKKMCFFIKYPFIMAATLLPGMSVFLHFFSFFVLYRMSAKFILPPKMTHFSLDDQGSYYMKNIMCRYWLHRLLNATYGK